MTLWKVQSKTDRYPHFIYMTVCKQYFTENICSDGRQSQEIDTDELEHHK